MSQIGRARFIYYILEQRLEGTAGGRFFQLHAKSGGLFRGAANWAANNPLATWYKTTHDTGTTPPLLSHGGPLPEAQYIILSPVRTAKFYPDFVAKPGIGRAAYLEPRREFSMHGRTGFFIHPGGHTDGCIIPMALFKPLMDALDIDNGGLLTVLESIEGDRFA